MKKKQPECPPENIGEYFTCRREDLEKQLDKFIPVCKTSLSFLGPFGLFLTLMIALITAKFDQPFLENAFIFATVAFGLWTIEIGLGWFKNFFRKERCDRETFISSLNTGYIALFILKNEDSQILVYTNKRWNCYFVINTRFVPTMTHQENQEYLKTKLARMLDIPDTDLHALKIDENNKAAFNVRKYSYTANRVKNYNYKFYDVTIRNENSLEYNTIKDVKYEWKNLSQLLDHHNTYERNVDVLEKIRHIYGKHLESVPPSIIRGVE